MNNNEFDRYGEEDWNEEPTSLHHLGQILDDIQNKSITKKDIKDYIELKSIVSSKDDPIKELLFLREHINILSSTMIYLINRKLYDLKNKEVDVKSGKIDMVDLENPLYSINEVGKILNLQRQSVYNIIKKGHIRVIKQPGRGMKISSQDLNEYIQKYRTKEEEF